MNDALDPDQLLPRAPAEAGRTLATPQMVERWWEPGGIRAEVGHELTPGGWGHVPCTGGGRAGAPLIETIGDGELDRGPVPEGDGTRLLLEHRGSARGTPSTASPTGHPGLSRRATAPRCRARRQR